MCGKEASKTRPHPPTCEFPSSDIQAQGGGDVVENDVHACVGNLATLPGLAGTFRRHADINVTVLFPPRSWTLPRFRGTLDTKSIFD